MSRHQPAILCAAPLLLALSAAAALAKTKQPAAPVITANQSKDVKQQRQAFLKQRGSSVKPPAQPEAKTLTGTHSRTAKTIGTARSDHN